jgi:glycosyltransferase involved in cell wall biosynthesis
MRRERTQQRVFLFGWPGLLGGASTKTLDFLELLASRVKFTVVPIRRGDLDDTRRRQWLNRRGIEVLGSDDMPRRVRGWAISFGCPEFLTDGWAWKAKQCGLKVAWSNEMVHPLRGELGALRMGLIDRLLFVSRAQRSSLEAGYLDALGRAGAVAVETARLGSWARGCYRASTGWQIDWMETGNFINPQRFRFRSSRSSFVRRTPLTVGRVSRADAGKYPEDFPASYESLGLDKARYRVMGMDPSVLGQWGPRCFGRRWELLPELAESAELFLRSLDLFVYELRAGTRESWGRVVVEAMLTGCVPLVPGGEDHPYREFVKHGVSGFLCESREAFRECARLLDRDRDRLRAMSQAARQESLKLMDRTAHQTGWEEVFQ